MRVFVAGSSNPRLEKKYTEGIDKIAEFLLSQNLSIMCTGTNVGAIGEFYNYYLNNNGRIHFLVADAYKDEAEGLAYNTTTSVASLYELQQIALHDSILTIILPGGNGTLAELYMLTDNIKTKFDTDPIIIYNCNGFYDSIKKMNDFMLNCGAMEQFQHDYFQFCNTPEDVITAIKRTLNIL